MSVIFPPPVIPDEISTEFELARERLIEAVAESDDELADKYLETGELSDAEVLSGARTAILKGDLVPILASSATQNVGVQQFLEVVREFMPSPVDGEKPIMGELGSDKELDFEVDATEPLAAFVFKTTADPFVGKLSVFRVYRGTITSNS